jgi:hypothetical protein
VRDPTALLARTVLVFEALVVLFGSLVARATSDLGSGQALGLGVALAVALVVTTGLLRWPLGYVVGSILQIGVLASAAVVPEMIILAVIFVVLWVAALLVGRRLRKTARRDGDEAPGHYAAEP